MKQCTGCGRYNNQPLGLNKKGEPYLACCPDNNYVEIKWSTRQSSCCGRINQNTDSDLCPDCKDHTSFEYYDENGNLLFEE